MRSESKKVGKRQKRAPGRRNSRRNISRLETSPKTYIVGYLRSKVRKRHRNRRISSGGPAGPPAPLRQPYFGPETRKCKKNTFPIGFLYKKAEKLNDFQTHVISEAHVRRRRRFFVRCPRRSPSTYKKIGEILPPVFS